MGRDEETGFSVEQRNRPSDHSSLTTETVTAPAEPAAIAHCAIFTRIHKTIDTWQAAREAVAKRTTFFADLLTLTTYLVFPSWLVFLEAITTSQIPPELLKNQKIE
jgi:hypothetical protein